MYNTLILIAMTKDKERRKRHKKEEKATFFKKSQKKGKKGVDKRRLAWYYN